jgi:hypothetical protein
MNSRWSHQDYEFVSTGDGSPTLKWLKGAKGYHGEPETMHHMGGAYSETQGIYGEILREIFPQGKSSVVSVGLGLGYIEMLVAVEAIKHGLSAKTVRTLSFESDPFLVEQFLKWIYSEADADPVYFEIYEFFLRDSACEAKTVKAWLLAQHQCGNLKLGGTLGEKTIWREKYHCIFYDAFSAKTSPELWEEKFLTDMFKEACEKDCIVSTYASKGTFKRALIANGFAITRRDGFHSKRNSMLGVRKA